jgi:hypothetical protein
MLAPASTTQSLMADQLTSLAILLVDFSQSLFFTTVLAWNRTRRKSATRHCDKIVMNGTANSQYLELPAPRQATLIKTRRSFSGGGGSCLFTLLTRDPSNLIA